MKRLKQELRSREKALAEAAALLIAYEKDSGFVGRGQGRFTSPDHRQKALQILDEGMAKGVRASKLPRLLGVGLSTLLQGWQRQFAGDGNGVVHRKGRDRLVAHRLNEE